MPTKGSNEQQEELIMRCGSNPVVWHGLQTVNLEAPNDVAEENYISLTSPEITLTFKLNCKSRKKTFKKYLMSLGLSRDTAELACVLVACHKGSLSYNDFFNYIFKDFPGAVIKTR